MVLEPTATAVKTPDDTVITAGFVLVHDPPPMTSVRVSVEPKQKDEGPESEPALGKGFTVTMELAAITPQELVTVYEMVVVPTAAPVTTPPTTVATEGTVLLHTPPVAASVSVIDDKLQTLVVPTMDPAFGKGFTVND